MSEVITAHTRHFWIWINITSLSLKVHNNHINRIFSHFSLIFKLQLRKSALWAMWPSTRAPRLLRIFPVAWRRDVRWRSVSILILNSLLRPCTARLTGPMAAWTCPWSEWTLTDASPRPVQLRRAPRSRTIGHWMWISASLRALSTSRWSWRTPRTTTSAASCSTSSWPSEEKEECKWEDSCKLVPVNKHNFVPRSKIS